MTESPPDNAVWLEKAGVLAEALPFMRAHAGETVVVKYGGHAMGDETVAERFAKDIVLLKQVGINPIVVHGGGPQIGAMLDRLKIKSEFIDGLRVTDAATVEIVEMVLCGSINKQIVTAINKAGGFAVGMSGKDGNLIKARKLRRSKKDPGSNIEKILDLGFVGEPSEINPHILDTFEESDIIPIIAPIGVGPNGETYNINADTVAGAVAEALDAEKLVYLTDIEGLRRGIDDPASLIRQTTADELDSLMADGTIAGGMIPKVESCVHAVRNGVERAHILDGRIPHVLLLEIFTDAGIGTMVRGTS